MSERTRRKSTRLSAIFNSPDDRRDTTKKKSGASSRVIELEADNKPTTSRGGSQRNSSASRKSGNSSGSADVIPTIRNRTGARAGAARDAVKSARRLDDFLDDDSGSANAGAVDGGDDSSRDLGEPSFLIPKAGRTNTRSTNNASSRAPAITGSSRATATAAGKRKRTEDDFLVPEVGGRAGTSSSSRGKARNIDLDDDLFSSNKRDMKIISSSSSPSNRTAKSQRSRGASRDAVPYTSTRTVEELPADIFGETPIAKRNRAKRAGLDGLGMPSSSSIGGEDNDSSRNGSSSTGRAGRGGERRLSLGLKGARRVSSLRNGSIAYPHDNVPDSALYRHCSSAMDPVSRMKYMLAWSLNRSMDQVFEEPSSAAGKAKGKKAAEGSTASKADIAKRKEIEPLLREVMARVVEDIDEQELSVSWFLRPGRNSESHTGQKPHPRNGPNKKAEAHLKALEERMQAEVLAWESEKQDLAEYEQETERLAALLAEGKLEELEAIAKKERPDRPLLSDIDGDALLEAKDEELDEDERKAKEEAEAAINSALALDSGSLPQPEDAKARRQSKGKAKALTLPSSQADFDGSEHDKRWEEVEFNIDLLRQDAHAYSQLSELASRYLQAISSRASRALDERAAVAAASVRSAGDSGSERRRAQRNVAELMRGVNAHRNAIPAATAENSETDNEPGAPAAGNISNSIDPADLLRALSNFNKSSTASAGPSGHSKVR